MDVFGGRGRSAATAAMPPPGGGGKAPLAAGAAGVTCAMAMTLVTVYASATVMPSRSMGGNLRTTRTARR